MVQKQKGGTKKSGDKYQSDSRIKNRVDSASALFHYESNFNKYILNIRS